MPGYDVSDSEVEKLKKAVDYVHKNTAGWEKALPACKARLEEVVGENFTKDYVKDLIGGVVHLLKDLDESKLKLDNQAFLTWFVFDLSVEMGKKTEPFNSKVVATIKDEKTFWKVYHGQVETRKICFPGFEKMAEASQKINDHAQEELLKKSGLKAGAPTSARLSLLAGLAAALAALLF